MMGMGIAWRPTGVTREVRKATATNGGNRSRLNILIAATAAIVGLIYGCDLGSIASTLLFLVPAFDLSTFMTSVVTLGQLLGALFAGRISNTIGRKRTMVIVALEYAVLFLSALGALGGSLTFGIFLLLSLFAIAFVYAQAPETKGRHSKLSEPTGTTAVAGQTRRRRPKPGPTPELRRSPGERIFA